MLTCMSQQKTVYVSYQFHWNTHMGITERRHEFNINCAKKADGTYTRDYNNLTKLQRQKKLDLSSYIRYESFLVHSRSRGDAKSVKP